MAVNDVVSSLGTLRLADTNESVANDMEMDHLSPQNIDGNAETDDEMGVTSPLGERATYEIYVDCCSHDAVGVYWSIMSGVGENAAALLADDNCFVVDLTRPELEKLVEMDDERIRGIYPPYRPL